MSTEQQQTTPDEIADVFELLNAGAEEYSKRKKSKKRVQSDDDKYKSAPPILTQEEFCEAELKKAHDNNYENPDFDFRDFYVKGDEVYFVRINSHKYYGKSLKTIKIRTVYPRMMVGVENGKECVCIGYTEKDQIFSTLTDAKVFFDSVNLIDEDKERELRKKHERQLKKQLENEELEDEKDDSGHEQSEGSDEGEET